MVFWKCARLWTFLFANFVWTHIFSRFWLCRIEEDGEDHVDICLSTDDRYTGYTLPTVPISIAHSQEWALWEKNAEITCLCLYLVWVYSSKRFDPTKSTWCIIFSWDRVHRRTLPIKYKSNIYTDSFVSFQLSLKSWWELKALDDRKHRDRERRRWKSRKRKKDEDKERQKLEEGIKQKETKDIQRDRRRYNGSKRRSTFRRDKRIRLGVGDRSWRRRVGEGKEIYKYKRYREMKEESEEKNKI